MQGQRLEVGRKTLHPRELRELRPDPTRLGSNGNRPREMQGRKV